MWVVNDATVDGSKTLTSFQQALYFKEIGFNVHDVMIYAKKNPMPQLFHKRYTDAFEYMLVLTKSKDITCNPLKEPCKHKGTIVSNGYKQISADAPQRKFKNVPVKDFKIKSNMWEYGNGGTNYGHSAVFPLQLAKDHILSWSNPNDLVLDCFMGSGTTGVACMELGRKFIGIEIDDNYFNTANERIREESEQMKLC